jgi:hypothetical protein
MSESEVSLKAGEQILGIFESIFFANTKSYAKRRQSVNQGPRWDCLIKKTEGQKSRDTVPLTRSNHKIYRLINAKFPEP